MLMCNVKNYFDAATGHQKVLEDESPGEDNKFYYGVHKDLRLELQCVCVCVKYDDKPRDVNGKDYYATYTPHIHTHHDSIEATR